MSAEGETPNTEETNPVGASEVLLQNIPSLGAAPGAPHSLLETTADAPVEEPALSESQPTISVDGDRGAALSAPEAQELDFEPGTTQAEPREPSSDLEEVVVEEEDGGEPKGSDSALGMEVDETGDPVPSLDRIQFRIANRDQANTEEDLILTVAALSIGEAFSEEQACIDVLYDHVASTLGIDSAEAMHKVDARARDIDQISERPHTSLSGLTVDPVEYLWPGARQRVHDLIPNIAPQLKAPMDQDPPAEGSDVPVPPQEIVGGEEIPLQPEAEDPAPTARQRAASAPEDKERAAPAHGPGRRRGSRAGRERQERKLYKEWQTQITLIKRFIYPFLGNVWFPYDTWYDTPPNARPAIEGFDLTAAQRSPSEHFWALARAIPPVREACDHYGYRPSTHEVAGSKIYPKAQPPKPRGQYVPKASPAKEAAVPAPRQPPTPPPPQRAVETEAPVVKAVLRPRSPVRSVQLDERTVSKETQEGTAAGAEERAAEAPEEDNLRRAAATGEFGVDASPETRFHRIQSSIRNLQYIGFDGAEGLVEAACQIVGAGNWEGTYADGRRPQLCGQPPLDAAESLLLDNYVAEYLRVQYRIQAEANFRATAEHWERGTRGRQERPSLRNPKGQRSRSVPAVEERSRTPPMDPRESTSRVSLLSRPVVLRPSTPGYPTLKYERGIWWQMVAGQDSTSSGSRDAEGPAVGAPAYQPTAEQAHPDDAEKWVDLNQAVRGVPSDPRRPFEQGDPDYLVQVPTEVMNVIEDEDPAWQEELKRFRAEWVANKAQRAAAQAAAPPPPPPTEPKAEGQPPAPRKAPPASLGLAPPVARQPTVQATRIQAAVQHHNEQKVRDVRASSAPKRKVVEGSVNLNVQRPFTSPRREGEGQPQAPTAHATAAPPPPPPPPKPNKPAPKPQPAQASQSQSQSQYSVPSDQLPKKEDIRGTGGAKSAASGHQGKGDKRAAKAPEPKATPQDDPALSKLSREDQQYRGRIENLRRLELRNVDSCHFRVLPAGFDESESLKLCIDWHNTLDGPRARTTFHTPTKQLTDLLRETQGSWREYDPKFMVLSYSGGTNAPEVASELARFCAFMQTEGVNFVGYAITWDRRGVHGKTAFLGKVGAQVLVDDDFLTGREAEQSGCKFIRSRASSIDWALELQHFAATTKGWYVKQSHTARVLGPGEWFTR